MTGLLFGMWANPSMTLDQLLLVLGFTIYIVIGVSLEERGLRRQWGPAYDDYRSRVGSIVPTLPVRHH